VIELGSFGLGTAPLAGLYEPVDDGTAHAIVTRAWELGTRYFDTAAYYGSGLAEERVGAALRGKPRDEYVVSTKVGRLLEPGTSEWHGAYFDFSADGALRSLEGSLERLGLDRVDVALVHDPDGHFDEALAGAFAALTRLREEGVVRAIGIGMNQTPTLARFAFDYETAPPDVVTRVAELRDICPRHGVPLAAAAVQFPRRHPAVANVLAGCRTASNLEEDVRLFELDLPHDLWAELG
jgi:D-threo-aldose 1-dehydrogenase